MAKAKQSKQTKSQVSEQNRFSLFAYALFAFAMAYGFGSWAIDSGSLWLYLFTYISVYYGVSYSVKFVKLQFFNNDKTRKAKKS